MAKPPVPKDITPERKYQVIQSENLFGEIDAEPRYIRKWYVDNIITRTLARIVGQGPYGPVPAKCTADGSLAVVARGGAFDHYVVKNGTASDEGVIQTFDEVVSRIDIFIYDNPAIVQLRRDLVIAMGDDIELFKNSFYSLDVYTKQVKIRNQTAGANARYRLIGWF
jgi:hypothetical protein